MRIIINHKSFEIQDSQNLKVTSGEAFLYPFDGNKLLKKYSLGDLEVRERKVRALCNLSGYFENAFGKSSIAYPLDIAYEEENSLNQFCGFSMNYFSNCYNMEKGSFDLIENKYANDKITDSIAVAFINDLFSLLDSIHFKRIILGDIKPSNIMVEPTTFKPIIVDLDSAQIPPNFPCTAISEEYLDPKIEQQGRNPNGYYLISTDSDIFSMAVVCYEFIVGMLPYDISVEPALTPIEAKNKGINLLVFHKHKISRLKTGYELQKNEYCNLALKRLDLLENIHKELYEFLCTILVFDKREYLTRSKRQKFSPPRTAQKKFISKERKYDKKDPMELLSLLKTYNIII